MMMKLMMIVDAALVDDNEDDNLREFASASGRDTGLACLLLLPDQPCKNTLLDEKSRYNMRMG